MKKTKINSPLVEGLDLGCFYNKQEAKVMLWCMYDELSMSPVAISRFLKSKGWIIRPESVKRTIDRYEASREQN